MLRIEAGIEIEVRLSLIIVLIIVHCFYRWNRKHLEHITTSQGTPLFNLLS